MCAAIGPGSTPYLVNCGRSTRARSLPGREPARSSRRFTTSSAVPPTSGSEMRLSRRATRESNGRGAVPASSAAAFAATTGAWRIASCQLFRHGSPGTVAAAPTASPLDSSLLAVGDAATVPGEPWRKSWQLAIRQAPVVAANAAAELAGTAPRPFDSRVARRLSRISLPDVGGTALLVVNRRLLQIGRAHV